MCYVCTAMHRTALHYTAYRSRRQAIDTGTGTGVGTCTTVSGEGEVVQIDCDGSYNSYYCCSTESADSREEVSLTAQLRKITWYDFSLTHSYSLSWSLYDLLSPFFPSHFFSTLFYFPSTIFPSIFSSFLISTLLFSSLYFSLPFSFLLYSFVTYSTSLFFALPPVDTRGALTIEEAIESLRALLKAVEIQEEGSVEEEEEREEEESEKGKDESKSNTVVTPSVSKAAAYRSYTISEIIRITE